MEINSPEALKRIFEECKVIAVVGLSSNPMRPSNGVAGFMRRAGYQVIPVNPNETTVFGQESYATLSDIPQRVDLVDVFRRSEEAGAVVDEAIKIGAKAVWLQEGVYDREAADRAVEAGLMVVMDRCWLKDYPRSF